MFPCCKIQSTSVKKKSLIGRAQNGSGTCQLWVNYHFSTKIFQSLCRRAHRSDWYWSKRWPLWPRAPQPCRPPAEVRSLPPRNRRTPSSAHWPTGSASRSCWRGTRWVRQSPLTCTYIHIYGTISTQSLKYLYLWLQKDSTADSTEAKQRRNDRTSDISTADDSMKTGRRSHDVSLPGSSGGILNGTDSCLNPPCSLVSQGSSQGETLSHNLHNGQKAPPTSAKSTPTKKQPEAAADISKTSRAAGDRRWVEHQAHVHCPSSPMFGRQRWTHTKHLYVFFKWLWLRFSY